MQQWICARFYPHLGCGLVLNNVNGKGFANGEPGLLPVMAWCGDQHVRVQSGVVLFCEWQNETYCFFRNIVVSNHCKPGVVLLLLWHTGLAPPKVRTPHTA